MEALLYFIFFQAMGVFGLMVPSERTLATFANRFSQVS
jgi:hypothetical protein